MYAYDQVNKYPSFIVSILPYLDCIQWKTYYYYCYYGIIELWRSDESLVMVVFGIVHTISCLLCTLSFLCIANSFVHRPSLRTIINNQHCRQPCCSISLSYKHPLTNVPSTLSHNQASKNSFTFPHSIGKN